MYQSELLLHQYHRNKYQKFSSPSMTLDFDNLLQLYAHHTVVHKFDQLRVPSKSKGYDCVITLRTASKPYLKPSKKFAPSFDLYIDNSNWCSVCMLDLNDSSLISPNSRGFTIYHQTTDGSGLIAFSHNDSICNEIERKLLSTQKDTYLIEQIVYLCSERAIRFIGNDIILNQHQRRLIQNIQTKVVHPFNFIKKSKKFSN